MKGAAFAEKVGKAESAFASSAGYMANMICSMTCGPPRKPRAYTINMEKVMRVYVTNQSG